MAESRRVYLDNNATTPPDPAILHAMEALRAERWANPASRHGPGRAAAAALSRARRTLAEGLAVPDSSIVFTSGGTESDNLAVRGVVLAAPEPRHVVVSAVEHAAVLATARQLAGLGLCELDVAPVGRDGAVDVEAFAGLLRPGHTRLASVMLANNETGVRQPVEALAARCAGAGVPLHVDAVAAAGKIPCAPAALGCDLLTLCAHKLHGPRGVGVLYIRPGLELLPAQTGGPHEGGRRAGSVDPALALGMAEAYVRAERRRPREAPRQEALRDALERGLREADPSLSFAGEGGERLPNTSLLLVPGVDPDPLLLELDRLGIAVSAGSACSSGALRPSTTLSAMGLLREEAQAAVRLSLGRETTAEDVDYVVAELPPLVARLRGLATQGSGR